MERPAAPRRPYVLSNLKERIIYACDLPYAFVGRQDTNKLQLFGLFRSIVIIIYYAIL